MTPADLARHPKVEGAIDRLADRIRSNGGISIPREAIADLLATLLTVLRESEGPVLDGAKAIDAAMQHAVAPVSSDKGWPTMNVQVLLEHLEAQAATRVAALKAQMKELEQAAFPTGDASDRDTLKRVKGLLRPDRGANGERTDNSEAPR